jgi:hypothetical protein
MMAEDSEICNRIYTIFKKLCFDINVIKKHPGLNFQSFYSDGTKYLQEKMNLNLKRFKKIKTKEEVEDIYVNDEVKIAEELKTFLKSCGCDATDAEISTMLHYVEKMNKNTNTLDLYDLCDIWGSVMNFAKLNPLEVFKYVLDYFTQFEMNGYDRISSFYSKEMNIEHVQRFLDLTYSYFEQKDDIRNYILKKVEKLDSLFSPECLTLTLIGPLNYFPK